MSRNLAPEGRSNLAQRFSAGKSERNDSSPGTTEFSRTLLSPWGRPPGNLCLLVKDHTYDMIQSTMANANRPTNQRRTFTLSPASLAYLEQQARERQLNSQSAFLDELLQEKSMEQRRAELEANVTAYYHSLSEAAVEENRSWGELAGRHLALSDEELSHAQSTAGRNLVHEASDRPAGKRKAPGGHRLHQRPKQSSAR